MQKFVITARVGSLKGCTWVISDGDKIVVGRDPSCNIVVDDPLVSRQHCELYVDNRGIFVRDLGSSNSTFVNGTPIRERRLSLGDDIGVGNVVLSVGVLLEKDENRKVSEFGRSSATKPLRIGVPVFIDSVPQDIFESGKPRTAGELAELFSLARTLSQLDSKNELIAQLFSFIDKKFQPDLRCLVQFTVGKEEVEVIPKEANSILSSSYVQRILSEVRYHPKGVLLPERYLGKSGDTIIRNTLVAPIALGRDVYGVLIVVGETPKHFYDENDVETLLAIAHTISPYLRAVERIEQLEWENQRLLSGSMDFDPLIGNSKVIQKIRMLARDCAHSDLSVLILGETGTGKELVARLIHSLSHRASKPMVVVNCAAIPDELFESELFGYEKGAFTGAHGSKKGLMEEADGSTLFLDEIGDLSLPHQARLLRAIETGSFRKVGSTLDMKVNVRVISATNKDLAKEVNEGRFRKDLYHRLNAFVIYIPPLRERKEDIPPLAGHFLKKLRERIPVKAVGFSEEAIKWLINQPWGGNVRELRNKVERAAVLAKGEIIMREDFESEEEDVSHENFPTLEELQKNHILEALKRAGGNVVRASELLGIGKSTLYRKIAEYGIDIYRLL
ncbi:MAG: sigma 54-interacting transcriptional regulator [Candidatus Hydrogenedentes bacterium]|nr:sigma 54-interacting transcriptional regulator [Candidatus Hydrogenedentota bacterium]